ncbi:MAG: Hsp20 family protein [Bacteroidota bacterium]
MKIDRNLTKVLAQSATQINTLTGGIVETQVRIVRQPESTIIQLKAPSLGMEAYNIEVVNHHLIVYATTDDGKLPLFHRTVPLPLHVNEESVEAVYQEGILQIILPNDQDLDRKRIDIQNNL